MQQATFISYNCQGNLPSNATSISATIRHAQNNQVHMICLQETHQAAKYRPRLGRKTVSAFSGHTPDPSIKQTYYQGVGTILNPLHQDKWTTQALPLTEPRLASVLSCTTPPLHVVNVYAPDTGQPVAELDDFLDRLQRRINLTPTSPLVIMGDINRTPTGATATPSWAAFITRNNLRVTAPTAPTNHQAGTIIDYIITRGVINPTTTTIHQDRTGHKGHSAHNPIECTIGWAATTNRTQWNLPRPPSRSFSWAGRGDINIEGNNPREWKDYSKHTETLTTNTPPSTSIRQEHDTIQSIIRQAAAATKPDTKSPQQITIKESVHQQANTHTVQHLTQLLQQETTSLEEGREEKWRSKAQTAEHHKEVKARLEAALDKFFNITKQGGVPKALLIGGVIETNTNQIANVLTAQYARTSCNPQDSPPPHIPEADQAPPLLISIEDIEGAIKALGNKAPGPDGIKAPMYKRANPKLITRIAELIQRSINEGTVPEQWRYALVHPIFKAGGSLTNPKDYRPISLTPILYRALGLVITRQLIKEIEDQLPTEQFGYKSKRTATMQVACLIQDLTTDTNKTAVLLDISKAYDQVPRHLLIQKLLQMGIHPRLVRCIAQAHSNTRIIVRGANRWQTTQSGVRQGCSMAPILFTIFTANWLSSWAKEMRNQAWLPTDQPTNDRPAHGRAQMYVDDTAIIGNDNHHTQELTAAMEKVIQANHLSLNPTKYKLVTASPAAQTFTTNIGTTISPNNSTRYLGLYLGSGNQLAQETLEAKKRQSVQMEATLRRTGLLHPSQPAKATAMAVTLHVWPKIQYGIEIWGTLPGAKGIIKKWLAHITQTTPSAGQTSEVLTSTRTSDGLVQMACARLHTAALRPSMRNTKLRDQMQQPPADTLIGRMLRQSRGLIDNPQQPSQTLEGRDVTHLLTRARHNILQQEIKNPRSNTFISFITNYLTPEQVAGTKPIPPHPGWRSWELNTRQIRALMIALTNMAPTRTKSKATKRAATHTLTPPHDTTYEEACPLCCIEILQQVRGQTSRNSPDTTRTVRDLERRAKGTTSHLYLCPRAKPTILKQEETMRDLKIDWNLLEALILQARQLATTPSVNLDPDQHWWDKRQVPTMHTLARLIEVKDQAETNRRLQTVANYITAVNRVVANIEKELEDGIT